METVDRNELIATLLPQIEAWSAENPDTFGIYPKVDLSSMRVEGTQDVGDSWDGRSNDTSDWRIVDLGDPLGEVAIYGGADDDKSDEACTVANS